MTTKKVDILPKIINIAEDIKDLVQTLVDDQPEGTTMLKQIYNQASSIQESVKIMIKYRELRNRAIYIYDPTRGDYYEAEKSQKIKIARDFLIKEGKI